MALVATQDWPVTMDTRQQRSHPNSPQHPERAQDHHQQPATPQNPYDFSYPHPHQPPWPPAGVNMAHNSHVSQPVPPPGTFYPQPMQFYPQQYPHPPPIIQQQQPHHPQQPHQQSAYPQQMPYFDAGQHAFAHWAYQQMMFNAQQSHQLAAPPPIPAAQSASSRDSPRSRSGSNSHSNPGTPTDYFPHVNPFGVNPRAFPSGTPPPHTPQGASQGQGQGQPYQGFHPYRRPEQRPRPSDPAASASSPSASSPPFQPPYARADAAGSSTSVNSGTGSNSSQRSRTNSGNSNNNSHSTGATNGSSNSASSAGSARGKPPTHPLGQHQRVSSSSSQQSHSSATSRVPSTSSQSSAPRVPSSSSSQASSPAPTSATSAAKRPSPLSQGLTYTASSSSSSSRPSTSTSRPSTSTTRGERRISRDDTDLALMRSQLNAQGIGGASSDSKSGLKGLGRLRRALSFNAANALREEEDDEKDPTDAKAGKGRASGDDGKDVDTDNETLTPTTATASSPLGDTPNSASRKGKKSRAASMFNARFNASTDNISLSSTVSSASVMIRKLGSMGRLARRNSLAGITSLFKDKEKDKVKEGKKDKDKDKDGQKARDRESGKRGKAGRAEASVSHVTAELDRMGGTGEVYSGPGMDGLSPAAKLARQHTLKSNAEAAARARAQAEVAAERSRVAEREKVERERKEKEDRERAEREDKDLPLTWDRNTATRAGAAAAAAAVREDGMRLVVEDSDSDSEIHMPMGPAPVAHRQPHANAHGDEDDGSGSDQEGTWRGHGHDEDDDEDVTIRIGREKPLIEDNAAHDHADYADDDIADGDETWAIGLRRSVERARRPAKGILKNAKAYTQDGHLDGPSPPFAQRTRANSYDSHPNPHNEAGPLARIPSPDPDHIDGLHKHAHHSGSNGAASSGLSFLPPLSFETESPRSLSPLPAAPPVPDKHAVFSHPNFNSSAPALSTMLTVGTAPSLTHRAATTPSKRLTFAANLSIYDTFSPAAYDRRSEPATWSRLTPALAQRIKEELNSYKMEEMEVHAASRVHTQFFV